MAILSICIPTFNRCGCLYFTLKSIVDQEIFQSTDDIEIVISDNCSTDFTPQIAKMFVQKYPDKIKYSRNEENILDLNFEKALSLGKGKVLKLHNDNFVFNPGALKYIINKIKELEDQKPMIFFTNHNSPLGKDTLCNNLSEFVQAVSFQSTWLAAFSIWKEDFDQYKNFSRSVDKKLIQTDVFFNMSASGKKIFVCNEYIFEGRDVVSKGGYNRAKIFGQNYLGLLKEYLPDKLDEKVYEHEKKVLFLNQIVPLRFAVTSRKKEWKFVNDGFWRHLFKDYWYNLYFYTSIVKVVRLIIDAKLNMICRKLNKNSPQKYWRKKNRHNQTTIGNGVDDTKVFVGENCVGNIDVEFSSQGNVLIISDNVIIGERAKFIFKDSPLIIVEEGIKISPNSIVDGTIEKSTIKI